MTRSRAIALMLAMGLALLVPPAVGVWEIAHGRRTPSSPLEQQWPEAGQ